MADAAKSKQAITLKLFLVIFGLASDIRLKTHAANKVGNLSRLHDPALIDSTRERPRILLGHLAAHFARPAAVDAPQDRPPFHRYFSPAAGNTGGHPGRHHAGVPCSRRKVAMEGRTEHRRDVDRDVRQPG